MANFEAALALVPPKEPPKELPDLSDSEERMHLMPLEDLLSVLALPREDDREFLEWSFSAISDRAKEKKEDDPEKLTMHGVMEYIHMENDMVEDLAFDAEEGESLLQRIASWGLSRAFGFVGRTLWSGVTRLIKWIVKEFVYNTVKAFYSLVIRPLITGMLEALVADPALWVPLGIVGGVAGLGWLMYKGFFQDKSKAKNYAEEGLEKGQVEAEPAETNIVTQATSKALGPEAVAAQAPMPANAPIAAGPAVAAGSAAPVANLIARGEGDYNSVNLGAAHGYKAAHMPLTDMLLSDILAGQRRHDFNAVGRYQIIGDTLRQAVKAMGLTGTERFDAALQDRIFTEFLIGRKRKAIGDYISGRSDNLQAAVLAASQEWASVAAPPGARLAKGGIGDGFISYYAGTANNRASITAAEMARSLQLARQGRSPATEVQNDPTKVKDSVTTKALTKEQKKQVNSANASSGVQPTGRGNKTIIQGSRGELIAVNV